jgi:hypothetical protein
MTNKPLPPQVYKDPAGFYVGQLQPDGSILQLSGHFSAKSVAETVLKQQYWNY